MKTEYPADELGPDYTPPVRDQHDLNVASRQLEGALRERLAGVLAAFPGPPALMLSGGVDSILCGAVLNELHDDILAVTVTSPSGEVERDNAKLAADALDFRHESIVLHPDELGRAMADAAARLDTTEVWEVLSGAMNLTAMARVNEVLDYDSALITGDGADVLMQVGSLDNASAEIWDAVKRYFIRAKPIPDYYERLFGEDDYQRYIKVFQTMRMWEATSRFAPETLVRLAPDGTVASDKLVVRHTLARLGIPSRLWDTPKDPMQRSSGIMRDASTHLRQALAQTPGNTTYTNPHTEDADVVLARLAVQQLTHLSPTPA